MLHGKMDAKKHLYVISRSFVLSFKLPNTNTTKKKKSGGTVVLGPLYFLGRTHATSKLEVFKSWQL